MIIEKVRLIIFIKEISAPYKRTQQVEKQHQIVNCIKAFIMISTIVPLTFLVAFASAGIVTYEAQPLSYAHSSVGSTSHNVERSFDGTVSQYSKAVDTPFSSIRKYDTRINNNVYTPAASTLAYTAPIAKTAVDIGPGARTISYSPAVEVAHVSFDGFGTHYAF